MPIFLEDLGAQCEGNLVRKEKKSKASGRVRELRSNCLKSAHYSFSQSNLQTVNLKHGLVEKKNEKTMAGRKRFELLRHRKAPNGFQDRRIQPLCHLPLALVS